MNKRIEDSIDEQRFVHNQQTTHRRVRTNATTKSATRRCRRGNLAEKTSVSDSQAVASMAATANRFRDQSSLSDTYPLQVSRSNPDLLLLSSSPSSKHDHHEAARREILRQQQRALGEARKHLGGVFDTKLNARNCSTTSDDEKQVIFVLPNMLKTQGKERRSGQETARQSLRLNDVFEDRAKALKISSTASVYDNSGKTLGSFLGFTKRGSSLSSSASSSGMKDFHDMFVWKSTTSGLSKLADDTIVGAFGVDDTPSLRRCSSLNSLAHLETDNDDDDNCLNNDRNGYEARQLHPCQEDPIRKDAHQNNKIASEDPMSASTLEFLEEATASLKEFLGL